MEGGMIEQDPNSLAVLWIGCKNLERRENDRHPEKALIGQTATWESEDQTATRTLVLTQLQHSFGQLWRVRFQGDAKEQLAEQAPRKAA